MPRQMKRRVQLILPRGHLLCKCKTFSGCPPRRSDPHYRLLSSQWPGFSQSKNHGYARYIPSINCPSLPLSITITEFTSIFFVFNVFQFFIIIFQFQLLGHAPQVKQVTCQLQSVHYTLKLFIRLYNYPACTVKHRCKKRFLRFLFMSRFFYIFNIFYFNNVFYYKKRWSYFYILHIFFHLIL